MRFYGLLILLSVCCANMVQGAKPELQPNAAQMDHPVSIAFSKDSSNPVLAVGFSGDSRSKLWHINNSVVYTSLRPRAMDDVTSVAVSPDANYWAEGGVQGLSLKREIGLALLCETDRPTLSARTIWKKGGYSAPGEWVTALAFSNDGKGLYLGRAGGRVDFFSFGKEMISSYKSVAKHEGKITDMDISRSGTCVFTSDDGVVSLLAKDGSVRYFAQGPPVKAVAITPDGKRLVTVTEQLLHIWDIQKERSHEFNIDTNTVAISPTDSNTVVFGAPHGKWGRFDLREGKTISEFSWPGQEIIDMDVSPDGRLVAIASAKGPVSLWTMDGIQVARLWHFGDIWVVADRESRFDSNNLRKLKQVDWNYRSTRFPLDVFMAQRHQDDLLHKIYHQKSLPQLEDISNVNFAQPIVKINAIYPNPDNPAYVTVQIEVSSSTKTFFGKKFSSGARNLRLFRDNQLIGQIDGNLLAGSKTQSKTHEFKVQVVNRKTEFMAYAFSDTGIKSESTPKTYPIDIKRDKAMLNSTGNFYLLSMGVNNHSIPKWNLDFAVNDGRELQRALNEVSNTSIAQKLVPIGLYSDDKERLPTKKNFKKVLDILAGRSDASTSDPFKASGFAKVQPNDIVFIAFAGHGYVDEKGIFYMFPSDIGSSPVIDDTFLGHGISSKELASWLTDVDAGIIVLLIDACHSAGSIDSAGFKPAPLDSAGLGQLAFDKNMLILAASQASNLALEDKRLKHGLLSYALVQEGLFQQKADADPQDGRIDLREWLRWSADRVPGLYQDLLDGNVIQPNTQERVVLRDKSRGVRPRRQPFNKVGQQPVLFDFSRMTQDCPYTIWKGPHAEEPSCGSIQAPTLTIVK